MNESQDFTKNVDSLSASNQNSTTSKVKQNNPTALSAICHFFLMIGSIITFIRNTVFNIIFIFLIIAIFALVGLCSKFEDSAKDLAWIEDPEVTNQVLTKPRAILYFDLNGPIIESALPNDDYSKFTRMLDAKLNNRNVNDILSIEKTLHNAAYNKTIKALYFNLSGLSGTTLSVAKRVIAAINQFKAVNKDADVIAYADNYSASAYAIASACKTIVLNPFGSFTFKGLSSTTLYFKDLFDHLRIDPVIFKAGEFKSAVEPFTNNKMSPQVKEEYQEQWIQCWAYDINASYPAAACDMLPDWENEIEFPGIVEEGECGFVVDCGYLHMVKEGEKASIRFPLKKSPLKPWFDKVARQEWGAKQRGDLVEAAKCKLKRNSVIGILRNHNVYVWLYIIEKAKENVMKYVDKNTIAVNIDCIYSKVPRTDLPINNKVGNFKVVDESGLEIYFRGTNYAWRNKQGEQLSPHLRGIPKELQRTYNIEFGIQQREPDYIFNEKGEIVENESRNERFTCENTREKL